MMKIKNSSKIEAVLNEIGVRLTEQRLEAKLTQASLAKKAAVSKRTVERIEAGSSVQLATLLQVLRVFKLLEPFGLALSGEEKQKPGGIKPAQPQKAKTDQDSDPAVSEAKAKSRSWGY